MKESQNVHYPFKDGNETELYRKEQMLLGQSFQMNETFSIPLPKTLK